MEAVSILVKGNVQGVGFRFYTATVAAQYDIKGWVKNTSEGHVAIEAIGNEAQLKRFIDKVQEGPPFSLVERIEVEEISDYPVYTKFDITY